MNNSVESKRIIYTPSKFAKESLIYLQEVGISKTSEQHTNLRNFTDSFLIFIVLEGTGTLNYDNKNVKLSKNMCSFINCHLPYSHTSNNWKIAWVHFNGENVENIYNKFIERENSNSFKTDVNKFSEIINDLFIICESNDYTKDMNIYNKLVSLLNIIMSETIYPDKNKRKRKYNIEEIKEYIDNNYTNDISLDSLSNLFYINKYYLLRSFKNLYGTTINNYILEKRITKSKELLRFSNKKIEDIASICGIKDANYYSRLFRKIEGITPKQYKQMW